MLLPILKSRAAVQVVSGCTCQQVMVATEDRLHRQTWAQPHCKGYWQFLHVLFSFILTKPMGDVMGGPLGSSVHCCQDGKQKICWQKQSNNSNPLQSLVSIIHPATNKHLRVCTVENPNLKQNIHLLAIQEQLSCYTMGVASKRG